jgi:hypothetical protein
MHDDDIAPPVRRSAIAVTPPVLEAVDGIRNGRLLDVQRHVPHLERRRVEVLERSPEFEAGQTAPMDHQEDDVATRARSEMRARQAMFVVPVVEQGNSLLPSPVEREEHHPVAVAPLDEGSDRDLPIEDVTLARIQPLSDRREYRLLVRA